MTKKKRFGVSQAISRGLSETIHVVENNPGLFRNAILPLSRIELDPDNPRKLAITLENIRHGIESDDPLFTQKNHELEKLKELAFTIQQSGIINPIVVYKRADSYRIVAGERRCLASILSGKQEIDARIFNEKPKEFELKLVQWIENTAREDLTLFERIENIRDILNEYVKQNKNSQTSPTLLKDITGLSLSQSSYYLTVLNATEDLQTLIQQGAINSLDKAALIASTESHTLRSEMLTACLSGATLKTLRKILVIGKKSSQQKDTTAVSKSRGRIATRVNLGNTTNIDVVKAIVHAVLAQHKFHSYAGKFAHKNWAHYDQASKNFSELLKIIEHELAE